MIAWLAVAAQAQDACPPMTVADWRQQMDVVDRQLARLDVDGALARVADLRAHCLSEPAVPSDVARFAQQAALVAFYDQDVIEAGKWAGTAQQAAPAVPWPADIDAGHPIRELFVDDPPLVGPSGVGLVVPTGGALLADGKPLLEPRVPAEIPVLMQVVDGTGHVVRSYWQDGAAFPADVLGPPHAVQPPRWYVAEDLGAAIAAIRQHRADAIAGVPSVVSPVAPKVPPPTATAAPDPLPVAVLGVVGGLGASGQQPDRADSKLSATDDQGAVIAIDGRVRIPVAGPILAAAEGSVALPPNARAGVDAWAGAGVRFGDAAASAGVGIASIAITADGEHEFVVVQLHLAVDYGVPLGALALDAGLGAGLLPAAVQGDARVGVRGAGRITWYAGIDGVITRVSFIDGTGDGLDATRWRAGLVVGVALASHRTP
jgi:hypothetical protein